MSHLNWTGDHWLGYFFSHIFRCSVWICCLGYGGPPIRTNPPSYYNSKPKTPNLKHLSGEDLGPGLVKGVCTYLDLTKS